MELGRVGVWQGGLRTAGGDDRAIAREVEALGYGALWFGEAPGGKEAFTRAATLLAATSTLTIGTGIASVWGRDPLTTASAVRTVAEAFPGRFVAGLGVSHQPAVEARGERYDRPLELHAPTTSTAMAAVGALVARADDRADHRARRARAADARAGRRGGRRCPSLLRHRRARAPGPRRCSVRTSCSPPSSPSCSRPIRARRDAWRGCTPARSTSRLPNYVRALRWLGWSDADLADGGSDAARRRRSWRGATSRRSPRASGEYLDAGADHVCLQPVTEIRPLVDGPDTAALDVLRRLAPVVTALGRD